MLRFVALQLLLFITIQGAIISSETATSQLNSIKENELRERLGQENRLGHRTQTVNSKGNGQSESTARQPRQGIMSDSEALVLSPKRQRRHIGSIAAFRGLPALPYNRFNSHEWISQATLDRKVRPGAGEEYGNPLIPPPTFPMESDSPFKRHPVSASSVEQSDMLKQLETEDVRGKPLPEIIAFPNNEARTRAVTRLLRLFSEGRMDPRRVGSISKKFIGALARNNALPPPTKPTSGIQYRGSLAIPLPGKRGFGGSTFWIRKFADDGHTIPEYFDEDDDDEIFVDEEQ